MNTIANFSPSEFVRKLWELRIPGYEGFDSGLVSLDHYLSSNPSFGGNGQAMLLKSALLRVAGNREDAKVLSEPGADRIFTGQGLREKIIAVMSLVNQCRAELAKDPGVKKYFEEKDFLQAMVNGRCFGLDCIGFIGTYLVDSGLEGAYVERRPLDYAAPFPPVKTLEEIKKGGLAAVMLANGLHVQLISRVVSEGQGELKVDLCQSTDGGETFKERGPQINAKVTLQLLGSGGNYLPVEEFRAAKDRNTYADEHAADNAERVCKGLKARDYESFLRAKLTKANVKFGYLGGAIFNLVADGDPKNAVGGSVYVGVAKDVKVKN